MTLGDLEKSRRSADLVGIAAWAGGELREHDGAFVVRRAGGFTARANSAVALRDLDEQEAELAVEVATAAAVADRVEDRWQVSEYETALSEVLRRRGARLESPTSVMIRASTSDLPNRPAGPVPSVSSAVTDEWFSVWLDSNGRVQREDPSWVATARRFFERLPSAQVADVRFVDHDGAVGMGVTTSGAFGEPTAHFVACMATRPERRRQGRGAAVLGTAAADGLAVLQVEEGNPAIGLYRAAGFEVSHRYHHVVLPR